MDATVMMLRLLVLLWVACGACTASAQSLPDPTRPPAVPHVSAGPAAAPAEEAPLPVLQSVLIGKDRRMAIISGQRFEVGDQVGDARIVRITETEVLLRAGTRQTTLKLFPQVLKRTRHPAPPAGATSNPLKKITTSGVESEA